MASDEEIVRIRSYEGKIDRARVEDLERRCEVGSSDHVLLFTDTMGDPICRIRNSPIYNYLVAECNNDLIGIVQGSIKLVTLHNHNPPRNLARVGYILGLRVSPLHRRKGIGSRLVLKLEDWFISNQVDYAYMATEKENEASVKLFVNKLGYVKFRKPAILVHPVNKNCSFHLSARIEIEKLRVDQAEFLYRKFMGSAEFFPHDIDKVLRNKLSLGTWVAYPRGEFEGGEFGLGGGKIPNNWAMLSVWNSGEILKLRIGKAPLSCMLYGKSSRLFDRAFPCFKVPAMPDFFSPFGFYFMYGVHRVGPSSGKLVRALCKFVHYMAKKNEDCKVVVTEIGGYDTVKHHIPYWKFLSCSEDLWCIKALKNEQRQNFPDFTKSLPTRALFVDPREV